MASTEAKSAAAFVQDLSTQFMVAAATGDIATLESVWQAVRCEPDDRASLQCGLLAPIPAHDLPKGELPLTAAVRHGQLNAVQWLIRHNFLDATRSRSCLDLAASAGHAAILTELLKPYDRPTLISYTYEDDRLVPLDRAIHYGHLNCTIVLEDALTNQRRETKRLPFMNDRFTTQSRSAVSMPPRARAALDVVDVGKSPASYARWGGWAAALCSCDDLPSLRHQDREVDRLLSKLDLLTECKTDIVDALVACTFSVEDRNRLSSPLLDGLWFAVTLEPPSASASANPAPGVLESALALSKQSPVTNQRLFTRLVRAPVQFTEAVEFLLERGVDCTLNDNEALAVASIRNHEQICELLFRFGAPPPPSTFCEILFDAVAFGSISLVELLLRNGAVLTAVDDVRKETALHYAVQRSDCPDRVTWLIEHGVDLYAAGGGGTVLSTAIMKSRVQTFHLLLHRIRCDFEAKASTAAAVSTRSTASVDPAAMNVDNETRQQKRFAAYLDRMMDIAAISWSPLHDAAYNDDPVFAQTLLQLGLDVDARDAASNTPLFRACTAGMYRPAHVFVAHGANVNATSAGSTPLLEAVSCGNLELVRLLVEAGATLEVANPAGRTALAKSIFTERPGELEVFVYLLDRGAKFEPGPGTALREPVLVLAAQHPLSIDMVQALLGRGANINVAVAPSMQTALHKVADGQQLEMCRFLLQHGADVNARAGDGRTPLHCAAAPAVLRYSGSIDPQLLDDVWKLLLEFGGDPQASSRSGSTPAQLRAAQLQELDSDVDELVIAA